MQSMIPLMIVPLVVWIGVWSYLWMLDNKVKKISAEIARRDMEGDD